MKAYVILDGGGVKGAALAGCLAAAEDQGVEIIGYAGTSAGAIVATLAVVGYSGREILELMKTTAHPKSVLDDSGSLLVQARHLGEHCIKTVNCDKSTILKAISLWGVHKQQPFQLLLRETGLYRGQKLREVLIHLITTRQPSLGKTGDVTFADLQNAGCHPLKIVASDLSNRKAAVFSSNDTQYGMSVIEAVRASSCYPYLFQPVQLADGRRLADGGLSSNLPMFLFAEEHRLTQHPILAFDLVSQRCERDHTFMTYSNDLLAAALEASDDLMVDLVPGVERIPVPVPPEIGTLKFDLSDAEVDALFDRGYDETVAFLRGYSRFQNTKRAGEEVQKQLWAVHGDRKLFEPVLWALASMVQARTNAKEVRSQIMLPTGRPGGSRIVTYCYGFRDTDADSDLELEEFAGCTGRCLRRRRPTVADLEAAKTKFADWGLSKSTQAKVATDRRAMLSVPIWAWCENVQALDPDRHPIIGILSVDSSSPLADTGWLQIDQHGEANINGDLSNVMTEWAYVVSKLLN